MQFPYGGRLCTVHLKQVYSTIQEQQSAANELNALTGFHSYTIEAGRRQELNSTNDLLVSLKQSPIKSQATIPLEEQVPSAIRRLTAKLRRAVSVAGNFFRRFICSYTNLCHILASNVAESIAPGQGDVLLQLAQLDHLSERRTTDISSSSHQAIDQQYLSYLIKMYHAYEENNLPFNEQVRILSLIPQTWNLTSEIIQREFNCSSHAVKTARQLNKITDVPLHIAEKP